MITKPIIHIFSEMDCFHVLFDSSESFIYLCIYKFSSVEVLLSLHSLNSACKGWLGSKFTTVRTYSTVMECFSASKCSAEVIFYQQKLSIFNEIVLIPSNTDVGTCRRLDCTQLSCIRSTMSIDDLVVTWAL